MSLVELHEASVGFEDTITDHQIRKTGVIAVPDYHWICDAVYSFATAVNCMSGWNLDITGRDVIQYGEYRKDGHYDWHMDMDPFLPIDGKHRKVTAVLMLSNRDSYQGGDFELRTGCISMQQGDMLIFPSFMEHRVTPVVSGVRRSIVCWATGPQFT